MKRKVFKIAEDFTDAPGGRYRTDGPFSGEELTDKITEELENLELGEGLLIDLDGTYGYASSFLEEAFGGLIIKHDNPVLRLDDQWPLIEFKSDEEPYLIDDITRYIREAKNKCFLQSLCDYQQKMSEYLSEVQPIHKRFFFDDAPKDEEE